MFLHVFYSWLIAQILHLIFFTVSLWLLDGRFFIDAEYVFYFLVASSIVSLPTLLLGWLCMGLIVYSDYTVWTKFFIWLATSAILVILTLWILILFFDGGLEPQVFLAALPGILSIWVASVIRLKQFHKLNIIENSITENTMGFETGIEDHCIKNH